MLRNTYVSIIDLLGLLGLLGIGNGLQLGIVERLVHPLALLAPEAANKGSVSVSALAPRKTSARERCRRTLAYKCAIRSTATCAVAVWSWWRS